jgi:hypothetical protein
VASASRTDVGEGIEVELSAAASSDPDGDPVSFSWRQTEGPPVALSDPAAPAPNFIVPPVGPAGSALAFEVNATDGAASSIASVVIQVHPLNFLVILTDDQTVASAAFMPTLQERIVGEGVWFDNAFATSPLCCPSRSSFLSGRYTHNHGVLTNSEPRGGATHFDDAQDDRRLARRGRIPHWSLRKILERLRRSGPSCPFGMGSLDRLVPGQRRL